jgi:hypothetical protein
MSVYAPGGASAHYKRTAPGADSGERLGMLSRLLLVVPGTAFEFDQFPGLVRRARPSVSTRYAKRTNELMSTRT